MSTNKEVESTLDFKPWTPDITSKEGRSRKIQRVRLSAQVSLFNLARTTSHPCCTNQENDFHNEDLKNDELSEIQTELKRVYSFDAIAPTIDRKFEQFKEMTRKCLFAAVENDPFIQDTRNFGEQNDINFDKPNLLKTLSQTKINIEHDNQVFDPNKSLIPKDNSETEESDYLNDSYKEISVSPKNRQQRHSIFFTSTKDEEQELKDDLQVENDPDIYFIQGDFFAYYQEGEIIGEGASGTVKKCTKNGTNEVFAVKIVRYRGDTERLFSDINEFRNHRKLHHKNIIKVYELYIDYFTKKTYLIMELIEFQEMFEMINEVGHFDEILASKIFKQILSGINYLHLNGVCHRDLKPSNILVSKDGETVKITDFNVSKFCDQKEYTAMSIQNYKMWTQTGTIAFTAPEVFNDSQYTEAVDLWSAGVILYTMLCGYQPFQANSIQELIEIIKEAKYEFHPSSWNTVSNQAKDLVKCLMNVDVKTRYSPFQALTHPWIENQKASNIQVLNDINNIWGYLDPSPKSQQPNPVKKIMTASSLNVNNNFHIGIMNLEPQNIENSNPSFQLYQKSPKKSPFSNLSSFSKLISSSTEIEGKCLDTNPNGEVKTVSRFPKIPHFNTQEELPFIFVPVTREFEKSKML